MDVPDGWLCTELRNHSPYDLCISPLLKSSSCVARQSSEQPETGILTYIYCVCMCHVYLWRGKDTFAVCSLFRLSWAPAMELRSADSHHKTAGHLRSWGVGSFLKRRFIKLTGNIQHLRKILQELRPLH